MKTYVVEGGVGKCLAFSALVDDLASRDGGSIQIHTPYHEVFGNNPKVKTVFDSQTIPLFDDRIRNSEDIIFCEPYKSRFIRGDIHLIESYCDLLGIEYRKDMRPKMFTDHAKKDVDAMLDKGAIKRRYVLVQFSGGQPYIGYHQGAQYSNGDIGRNYHPYLAQQVVNRLLEDDKDRDVIQFALPNEPILHGVKTISSSLAGWHEVAKNSEGFIGIDSCLNHFAPSAGIKGVVLWGSTRFSQFGYPENKNLNAYFEDEWQEDGFAPQDPRNMMIDPERVFQLYKEMQ